MIARAVIVAGVSGSGKSTIGSMLADVLACEFVEGDDHHPPANLAKMARGEPLDDQDRAPWLASLRAELDRHAFEGLPVVVTCSALKRRYREFLTSGLSHVTTFLLHGSQELLQRRLRARTGHFFNPSMLHGQLDALEWPASDERVTTLSIEASPDDLVARIVEILTRDRSLVSQRPVGDDGSTR